MKRLIIINPKSRHGKSLKVFQQMESDLQQLLGEYTLYHTQAARDCTQKVRQVLTEKSYDQILIAGGDGSVNEAVNGYFLENSETAIDTEIPLGVINLGTGGDFIKTLKQNSQDYRLALQTNHYQKLDCAITHLYNQSHPYFFTNISSVGMAGDVNVSLKTSKFQYGRLAYFWHTLKTLIRYKPPTCMIRILDTNDKWQQYESTLMNFFACNGMYNGGGMHWAPRAKVNDGLLNFVLIKGISKWKLFFDSYKVYAGKIDQMAGVSQFQGKQAHIISHGYTSQEVDGEIREIKEQKDPMEFHFRVIPAQIPFNL